jgi:hypothetical protein
VLILIQNKHTARKLLSPQEATEKFLKTNAEVEELLYFFSAIRCILLPFKHSNKEPNTSDKFDEQVLVLRKLFICICEQHHNHLLPHLLWLLLTQQVIKKLSKNEIIMKHMVLQDVLVKEKGEDEDFIMLFLFRRLYERRNVHSTRWFHYCRLFAMNVLACSTAIRCPRYEFGKVQEFIERTCEDRLNVMKNFPEINICPLFKLNHRQQPLNEKNVLFAYHHPAK